MHSQCFIRFNSPNMHIYLTHVGSYIYPGIGAFVQVASGAGWTHCICSFQRIFCTNWSFASLESHKCACSLAVCFTFVCAIVRELANHERSDPVAWTHSWKQSLFLQAMLWTLQNGHHGVTCQPLAISLQVLPILLYDVHRHACRGCQAAYGGQGSKP